MIQSGTVAFLFTDIEGSTRLWEEAPAEMEVALRRHDQILRSAANVSQGYVFKTIGDAFCIAFATVAQALQAAIVAQRSIHAEEWPGPACIRTRMAIHIGAVELRDGDYFGQPLNRVARLMNAAHGGQILLSQASAELVRDNIPAGFELKSLGEHRLKDLTRPEPVFEVAGPGLPSGFPPLRSLTVQPNNLPIQMTSFVGREKETADVREMVMASRLVTLTGSGGTGKTRLGLQAAAELAQNFDDGVWFVELAPVADPRQLPIVVAEVLGVSETAGADLGRTISDALAEKKCLIVLDNCEHLIEAGSRLADQILRSCRGVQLLVTSREALRIAGEQTYRVPPLSLPNPNAPQTVESLSQFEAVRLFIDRALLLNPSFVVSNETAPALASLCHQLDGIPLAIELAAARIRALPVPEIARRLDQRFQMLTGGARTALPRQQTLRALVDWSYELLNPTEKVLFARLATFAGGFSMAAVEAVCGHDPIEDWEVLDLLTSLVDKSLVLPVEAAEDSRFTLQETIRQYAAEKLSDASDLRDRHLRYFADFAAERRPHLDSADQAHHVRLINREMDNIRAAMRWGMSPACQAKDALAILVTRLGRYWYIRGTCTEGEAYSRATLAEVDTVISDKDRAVLENTLGLFADYRGEYDLSQSHYETSARIAREIGDVNREATAYNNIAGQLYMRGKYVEANDYYRRALELYQSENDLPGIGMCFNNQACCLIRLGDLEQADRLARLGLETRQKVNEPWNLAYSYITMGEVALERGEYASARDHYLTSLKLREDIEDVVGVGWSKAALGWVAVYEADWPVARQWLAAAMAPLREENISYGVLHVLLGLARCAAETDPGLAARLVGAWEAISEARKIPPSDSDLEMSRSILALAPDADAFRLEGRGWNEADAVTAALR